jgi:hypothetical protein
MRPVRAITKITGGGNDLCGMWRTVAACGVDRVD